jgi:CubicO group peptidase (beta-lactamase class C family)
VLKGFDFSSKKGGWGLSSTAEDYLHFNQMLLNGGELFGRRILSSDSVKLMSSNQVGDLFSTAGKGKKAQKGMGFGYTVAVTLDPDAAGNHRGKGAFGWGGAGGTSSWADPENELVAVRMLQQERGGNFAKAVQQAIINSTDACRRWLLAGLERTQGAPMTAEFVLIPSACLSTMVNNVPEAVTGAHLGNVGPRQKLGDP